MKPGTLGGGLPPITSTLRAAANAMTAPVEATSRMVPRLYTSAGKLTTILDADHGRYSFRYECYGGA